jgi:hypothetical protein
MKLVAIEAVVSALLLVDPAALHLPAAETTLLARMTDVAIATVVTETEIVIETTMIAAAPAAPPTETAIGIVR